MFGLTPYNKDKEIKRLDYLDDFFHLIDDMFNQLFPFQGWEESNFVLDLKESEAEYIITANLPNCNKENIEIGFENGLLMTSAYHQMEQTIEQEGNIQKEQAYSKIQRSIYLQDAEGENIKAKYENSVLKIIVPKSKTMRSNRPVLIE